MTVPGMSGGACWRSDGVKGSSSSWRTWPCTVTHWYPVVTSRPPGTVLAYGCSTSAASGCAASSMRVGLKSSMPRVSSGAPATTGGTLPLLLSRSSCTSTGTPTYRLGIAHRRGSVSAGGPRVNGGRSRGGCPRSTVTEWRNWVWSGIRLSGRLGTPPLSRQLVGRTDGYRLKSHRRDAGLTRPDRRESVRTFRDSAT